MKTISVVIPCYNEEKSIWEMYHRLKKIFEEELTQYDYEIIYVDDFSKDNTRVEIEKLCTEDEKVKAVFNAKILDLTATYFSLISMRQVIVHSCCSGICRTRRKCCRSL